MSDFLEQQHPAPQQPLKREHDSSDDFEHLEHELHANNHHHHHPQSLLDFSNPLGEFDDDHHLQTVPPPTQLGDLLDNLLDTSIPASKNLDLQPVPATPPPSAEFGSRQPDFGTEDELEAKFNDQLQDSKAVTMAFMESEKMSNFGLGDDFGPKSEDLDFNFGKKSPDDLYRQNSDDEDNTEPTRSEPSVTPSHIVRPPADKLDSNLLDDDDMFMKDEFAPIKSSKEPPNTLYDLDKDDFMGEIKSSTLPEPEKSPELDFVKEEIMVSEATKEMPVKSDDQMWNVLEKSTNDKFIEKEMFDEPPTKPLPPLPKGAEQDLFDDFTRGYNNKFEATNDFLSAESKSKGGLSGGETGDSEFESEPEPSPAKTVPRPAPPLPKLGDAAERKVYQKPDKSKIVSKQIIREICFDAWFNPERLNPKVAALIYWRDPKKSGIVFGAIMSVLLSLAYFSLISVVAYISLLTLTCTVAFRIYKTVLQAVQKTSDGHPFKEILDFDLSLPSEKVHEVADIAVANVNAALCELRRLFLVEDIVDSLKFGVLLWSLTYLGSWFNGMTLIIIGVVALFSLPKVYETNKTQIDQHLGVVQAKINEITAKVKAALPIGKKTEATKED